MSGSLIASVAVVTGAAGGIGRAIALTLARSGAQLAIVDVDVAGLNETLSLLTDLPNLGSSQWTVDLSQPEVHANLISGILARHGRIDILINAAGITGAPTALAQTSEGDWDRVFALNVKAPFLLIKAAAKHMTDRGSGRIVNITSSSAHRARSAIAAYAASKSALMQLTRTAAAELGPHGITVNAVAPGLTRTKMVTNNFSTEQLDTALRDGPVSNLLHRISEPEDIAEAVLFLCLPSSRQITAQTIHVSAGSIV